MTKNAKTPHSLVYTLGLLATLLATATHAYLAYRHFELSFGQPGADSLCNLNQTFNCDTVTASSYSRLLGIPLALWGLVTNIILLIMAFSAKISWKEEFSPLQVWTTRLSLVVVLASIAMGLISFTQMSVYCPFCIVAYILSFISLWSFSTVASIPIALSNLAEDIKELFTQNKMILTLLIAIPIGAWLFNGIFHSQYKTSTSELKKFIRFQVQDWQAAKTHSFKEVSGLTLGASTENAKMTIVEFADFLCGHCKAAWPKLHAFTKSHKDVRLKFLNYPLDGACNSAIKSSVAIRCQLAKATHCAEKENKGWEVHDYIFTHSEKFYASTTTEESLSQMIQELKIAKPGWDQCMNSEETQKAIVRQTDLGNQVGVKGTPTIFVNGKKLIGGQTLPVLEAVYQKL